MSVLIPISCKNCGAPIDLGNEKNNQITCENCSQTYLVNSSFVKEATKGNFFFPTCPHHIDQKTNVVMWMGRKLSIVEMKHLCIALDISFDHITDNQYPVTCANGIYRLAKRDSATYQKMAALLNCSGELTLVEKMEKLQFRQLRRVWASLEKYGWFKGDAPDHLTTSQYLAWHMYTEISKHGNGLEALEEELKRRRLI